MKELLIVAALTLFVLSEAKPSVVKQKPVEPDNSVKAEENHVRVRRGSTWNYNNYMESDFWDRVVECSGCNFKYYLGKNNDNENTDNVQSQQNPDNQNNQKNQNNNENSN